MNRIATRPALAVLVALALEACESGGTTAPPVSQAMLGASRGASRETLEGGRRILATRCAGCHALEPVAKYSVADWHAIVARMSPRAKLEPAQETALLAYLAAARETPGTR